MRTNKLLIFVGVCLLIAAAAVLLWWQLGIQDAAQKAESYVHIIRTQTPEPQSAVPEKRQDNTMAALSIDYTDFVGILEMPGYGLSLPVCEDWGETAKYSCRFSGSIYDRSIQIGATTQKGQLDFYRDLSVGDAVYFTDMEGNRFSYEITDIRYQRHADQAALQQKNADLTLFIQNIYAMEYIILFCNN